MKIRVNLPQCQLVNNLDIMLCGDLKDIIKGLTNIQQHMATAGYTDIRIEMDAGYNNVCITSTGSREETKAEKRSRLESTRKQKKLAAEKIINERLSFLRKARRLR